MNYTTEKTGKKLQALGFEPTDKSWLWTLDEVLDMLPACRGAYQFHLIKSGEFYLCGYYNILVDSLKTILIDSIDINPTEAAAQLLIKLAESGHIKKEN